MCFVHEFCLVFCVCCCCLECLCGFGLFLLDFRVIVHVDFYVVFMCVDVCSVCVLVVVLFFRCCRFCVPHVCMCCVVFLWC